MASLASDCLSFCSVPSGSGTPSLGKQWRRSVAGISYRWNPVLAKNKEVRSGKAPRFSSVLTQEGLATETAVEEQKLSVKLNDGDGSFPRRTFEKQGDYVAVSGGNGCEPTVSFTVVGASGDLAKKKIYPALFALFYEGCLPEHFTIFGYARSNMTDAELRTMISSTLTSRISKRENCSDKINQFLQRCYYHSGQYDSVDNFAGLDKKLKEHEGGSTSNRLFYLSVPPNVFIDAVKCASESASSSSGWTRVIVEKPFGRDSESSAALTRCLKKYLREDQIFRIDHYLGKELVENLSVLRFSNLIFEPLWSRQYIRSVQLIFSEDFGTEGRGGYFDSYGIIRDIMQNHLLQILALFAMETPVSLDAEDIRNEKVKVLRSMRPLQLDNVVIGQYKSHTKGAYTYPGYLDDKTVPKDSRTPTFAAAALFIDNARWDGVPFLMKAGKALHASRYKIFYESFLIFLFIFLFPFFYGDAMIIHRCIYSFEFSPTCNSPFCETDSYILFPELKSECSSDMSQAIYIANASVQTLTEQPMSL
ncbi:unnamed protein product [Victoria cruziana]